MNLKRFCKLISSVLALSTLPFSILSAQSEGMDIVIAIDGSTSITSAEFAAQKSAVKDFIKLLPKDGSIGLVLLQYGNERANIFIDYVRLKNLEVIIQKIDGITQITPLGETSPEKALEEAWKHMNRGIIPEIQASRVQQFCLITDGKPNSNPGSGAKSEQAFAEAVMKVRTAEGISFDKFSVVTFADSKLKVDLSQLLGFYQNYVFGGGIAVGAQDSSKPGVPNSIDLKAAIAGTCFPQGKVKLRALEVTQVIQDWKNSITLIENKKTYVRVFLRYLAQTAELALIQAGSARAR